MKKSKKIKYSRFCKHLTHTEENAKTCKHCREILKEFKKRRIKMQEKNEKTDSKKTNLQKALLKEYKRVNGMLDDNLDLNVASNVLSTIELSKYRLFLAECLDQDILNKNSHFLDPSSI